MADETGPDRSPLRLILAFLLLIALPLAIGLYFAPRVVPKPRVGIVRLNYEIYSVTAFEFIEQLEYARNDPSIGAIVIVINSPGGTASDSEEIFMDVLNTRRQMPVVASVDFLAASGAYYVAVAADEIYAKSGSAVGSIGVISSLPTAAFIEEEVLTTGPYKAFGLTRDGAVRRTETLKFTFLEAVANGRGDRLQVDLDFLSRAEIFDGLLAQELGLIDELKSTNEAIERAAELAGLKNYDVVELYPLTFLDEGSAAFANYQPPPVDLQKLWAPPSNLAPGMYYRHIELPSFNR